ncbi:hypothetical protein [Rhodococcus sp. UFZ-B548]|uniref:hypothetical protein n=1 Tax=Rhodococcus sp. UFZ-B548 TaxID=2742212 RepID=UPI0015F5E262|nr:hypothetical protein [Rhodococcus sp. UFZ-B548]
MSLAVDDAGDVVVGDAGMLRAFELKAGGSVPQEIDFGTYINAGALDVDGNGNIYTFSDYRSFEVLMANAGDRSVVALPFGGALGAISGGGLAVNRHGDVFVTKYGTGTVFELKSGATSPVVHSLGDPLTAGITVDDAGNLFAIQYVAESNEGRIIELKTGETTPVVLPFAPIRAPLDIDVDDNGNLYVSAVRADGVGEVLKFVPGAVAPTVVPISGDWVFSGVAVSGDGRNIYVGGGQIDSGLWGSKVLRLSIPDRVPEPSGFGSLGEPFGS